MSGFLINTIPVRYQGVRVMVHRRLDQDKRICVQYWRGSWRVFHTDNVFTPVVVDHLDDAMMFAEAHCEIASEHQQ